MVCLEMVDGIALLATKIDLTCCRVGTAGHAVGTKAGVPRKRGDKAKMSVSRLAGRSLKGEDWLI